MIGAAAVESTEQWPIGFATHAKAFQAWAGVKRRLVKRDAAPNSYI